MPVFDTPITTSGQNLQKVLAQNLPVALYLFSSRDKSLDDALAALAKEHAGKLLVARVDANENPQVLTNYGRPGLPAIITFIGGTVKSKGESVRSDDLRKHIDYLLGRGAMPQPTPARTVSSAPVHVTDTSFRADVLGSSMPVLVDFWAEWCGPCHMIAPHLERMAGEFAGRVKVAKLDVDKNPQIAQQYDIRAIPTFITFRNGKIIRRQSGADPNMLRQMLQEVASTPTG
jgi:thioredoxin 1